jgi:hypothetical protein
MQHGSGIVGFSALKKYFITVLCPAMQNDPGNGLGDP